MQEGFVLPKTLPCLFTDASPPLSLFNSNLALIFNADMGGPAPDLLVVDVGLGVCAPPKFLC